jgi:hypothetical protein
MLMAMLGAASPSWARDINLPKQTVDQIKATCEKAGGKFSQDSNGYGCGTDCHGAPGTDCVVFCKADKRCVAQVIGSRRPHDVLSALQAPAKSPR